MTYHQIHDKAAKLARERGISHSEALAILGQRGAASRQRKVHGVLHPMRADRAAFAAVESPRRPYWWQRED